MESAENNCLGVSQRQAQYREINESHACDGNPVKYTAKERHYSSFEPNGADSHSTDTSETSVFNHLMPQEVIIDGFAILAFRKEEDLLRFSHQSDKERHNVRHSPTEKPKRSRRSVKPRKQARSHQTDASSDPTTELLTSSVSGEGPVNGYAKSLTPTVPLDNQNGSRLPRSVSNDSNVHDEPTIQSNGSDRNRSNLRPEKDSSKSEHSFYCSASWNHITAPPSAGSNSPHPSSVLSNVLDCHLVPLSASWSHSGTSNPVSSPLSPFSGRWNQTTMLGPRTTSDYKSPQDDPIEMPALDDSPVRSDTCLSSSTPTTAAAVLTSAATSVTTKPSSTCHLFSVAALTDRTPHSTSRVDSVGPEERDAIAAAAKVGIPTESMPKQRAEHSVNVNGVTERANFLQRTHSYLESPKQRASHKRDSTISSKAGCRSSPAIQTSPNRTLSAYQNQDHPTSVNKIKDVTKLPDDVLDDLSSFMTPDVISARLKQQLMALDSSTAERLFHNTRFGELYSAVMSALVGVESKSAVSRPGVWPAPQKAGEPTDSYTRFTGPIPAPISKPNDSVHPNSSCSADIVSRNVADDSRKRSSVNATGVAHRYTPRKHTSPQSTTPLSRNPNMLHSAYNDHNFANQISSLVNTHPTTIPLPTGLPPLPPLTAGPRVSDDITDSTMGPLRSLPSEVLQRLPPPPLYGFYQQPHRPATSNHDPRHWSALMRANTTGLSGGAQTNHRHSTVTPSTCLSQRLPASFTPSNQRVPGSSVVSDPASQLPLSSGNTGTCSARRPGTTTEQSLVSLPASFSTLYRRAHPGNVYGRWADAHVRIAHHIRLHQAGMLNTYGQRKHGSTSNPVHRSGQLIRPTVHSLQSLMMAQSQLGEVPTTIMNPFNSVAAQPPASASNPALIRPGSQLSWPPAISASLPLASPAPVPDEKNVFLNYLLTGLLSHLPQTMCNGQRTANDPADIWKSALQQFCSQSSSSEQLNSSRFLGSTSPVLSAQAAKDLFAPSSRYSVPSNFTHPAPPVFRSDADAKRRRIHPTPSLHSNPPVDLPTRTPPIIAPTALTHFPPHPMELLASGIPRPDSSLYPPNGYRFPSPYLNPVRTGNSEPKHANGGHLKLGRATSHLPPIHPW